MNFTNDQLEAIAHDSSHLQLIACAGSGKTEVVARRVAGLLDPSREDRLLPANIVAFTFTEKAASELRQRVIERTRSAHGEIVGMAEMFVGSIHAFCLDLLVTEVPEYMKYEVLNQVQQGLFVNRNSRRSGLTTTLDLKQKKLRRSGCPAAHLPADSRPSDSQPPPIRMGKCLIITYHFPLDRTPTAGDPLAWLEH